MISTCQKSARYGWCESHRGGSFDNPRARECDIAKFTPQGYSVLQMRHLLRDLAEYARTEHHEPKTIDLPHGKIKYCVTVRGAGAAHGLYHALTGKKVDGGIELRNYPKYFSGTAPNLFVSNHTPRELTADDAMRLYGHPFHAAKILQRQLENQDRFDEKCKFGATMSVINELIERAAGQMKVKVRKESSYPYNSNEHYETEPYNVEAELAKIGAPLSPVGSLVLTADEQAELDAKIAEIQATERAEQERLNKLIPVELCGLTYYVRVGEWEKTDWRKGILDLYNETGEAIIETRGKHKGYAKRVEKKKLNRVEMEESK